MFKQINIYFGILKKIKLALTIVKRNKCVNLS